MSALPVAVVQGPALARRIAELRSDRSIDVMEALRSEAADEQQLLDELGAVFELPVLRAADLVAAQALFDQLPFAECARRRCALLCRPGSDAVHLVSTDPFDTDSLAWARTRFGAMTPALASNASLDAWLAHCEETLTALGSLAPEDGTPAAAAALLAGEQLSLRHIGSDDSPAVRFVNSTLYDALKAGASDIHLESDASGLTVKFRLDGVLTAMQRSESPELAMQVISRIKVLAQLDIAERRVPQDGRLQIVYADRPIDVRVSIMPSIHGEDAVLRILDRQHLAQSLSGLTLAKLGFDEASAAVLRRLCSRPHGMLLVTGPTGSGKTTTLYAAIAETHQSRDKIITIEDPVEYQLRGVLQIPVNERKGLTFARGLRSILRHDPDRILVGEIRDSETAQIAVQSALTGHLVFTTVHANSVFDVMGRFEQFGIDAYTFASAINGVLAQRLMRKLCAHCAAPASPTPTIHDDPEVAAAIQRLGTAVRLMEARGCEHCRHTGYAGRFALSELLVLSAPLKALLAARAPQVQLQAEAERLGWRSLRALAIDAALAGRTTLEEADRVAL
jgi:general secretion pathway protein E